MRRCEGVLFVRKSQRVIADLQGQFRIIMQLGSVREAGCFFRRMTLFATREDVPKRLARMQVVAQATRVEQEHIFTQHRTCSNIFAHCRTTSHMYPQHRTFVDVICVGDFVFDICSHTFAHGRLLR